MVRHRELTYKEKKFNRLGRRGLIDNFKTKYDTTKIRMWALEDRDYRMSTIEAKAIAAKLEADKFEEDKDFVESLVDSLLHFCQMFDLSNLEGYAMWCRVMIAQGKLKKSLGREPSEEESGACLDRSMRNSYDLYEKNPNRFLDILRIPM